MAAAGPALENRESETAQVVCTFVLARLAGTAGTSRADLGRDLTPYLAPEGTAKETRRIVDDALIGLEREGLFTAAGGELALTASGLAAAAKELGARKLPQEWIEIRDTWLTARALGLHGAAQRHVKALQRPGPLRAAVLQKTYGLAVKAETSAARLRSALAVVVLERAFGNKVRSSLGRGAGLSAKAGRLLAAQLSGDPKDFGTDGRLVAALAAEQAGAARTGIDALRTAILRSYAARSRLPAKPAANAPAQAPVPVSPPAPPPPAQRPDLAGFAQEVRMAARARAEGWPGNRKAYISHVWQAIRAAHPEWALSEIEFKGMLAEAHRAGHVVLANADLKTKGALTELKDSALVYKNTVLHFVRVAD